MLPRGNDEDDGRQVHVWLFVALTVLLVGVLFAQIVEEKAPVSIECGKHQPRGL